MSWSVVSDIRLVPNVIPKSTNLLALNKLLNDFDLVSPRNDYITHQQKQATENMHNN